MRIPLREMRGDHFRLVNPAQGYPARASSPPSPPPETNHPLSASAEIVQKTFLRINEDVPENRGSGRYPAGMNPQPAADKIPARGNVSVFSTHLNGKKIPVTGRLERRSTDGTRFTAAPYRSTRSSRTSTRRRWRFTTTSTTRPISTI